MRHSPFFLLLTLCLLLSGGCAAKALDVESATYNFSKAWIAKVSADGRVQWTDNTLVANFEDMLGKKPEGKVSSNEKTGTVPASQAQELFAIIKEKGFAAQRPKQGEPWISLVVHFKDGTSVTNLAPSNIWPDEEQKTFAPIEEKFVTIVEKAGGKIDTMSRYFGSFYSTKP